MHLNSSRFFIQKTLLIFCLVFTFSLSFSQVVNIENKRIYDDTSGISGVVDASVSAMKTKDLLMNFSFRPVVQYKTPKHYFLFINDLLYSKGGSHVYANSGVSHFRYAYRIKGPLKWESYAQIQYNQLLDQRSRALLGTGLRMKLLDTKGYRLFLGSSTFYEMETIASTDLTTMNMRWSNYFSWFIDPKSHYSFSGVMYYQPIWSYLNDFRFMGQYTLTFHFTKRTDFKIEVSHFYDSRPATGVVKSYFNSTFGIKVKLGK